MTGSELIKSERLRQIDKEGWSFEHDDQHNRGELIEAALCYIDPDIATWPWDKSWDKRNQHNHIRRLAIAGALIAAEIDRLQREDERRIISVTVPES